jgi:hypothetical protein
MVGIGYWRIKETSLNCAEGATDLQLLPFIIMKRQKRTIRGLPIFVSNVVMIAIELPLVLRKRILMGMKFQMMRQKDGGGIKNLRDGGKKANMMFSCRDGIMEFIEIVNPFQWVIG